MTAKLLQSAIGFAVTALCLWLAFRGIEPATVMARIAGANWGYVVPMTGVLVVFFALKSYRWALLLRPVAAVPVGSAAQALLIGFMGNNVLPLRLGEGMRAVVLSRRHGLSAAAVLSSIVLERLLDAASAVALLVVAVACLPELGEVIPGLAAWVTLAACGVAAIFGGLTLYVLRTEWFVAVASRLLRAVRFVPDGFVLRIEGLLRSGSLGMDALRRPRLGLPIVAVSLAKWVVVATLPWLALAAFGRSLSPAASAMTNSVIALGIAAPSAPGFFGVVQYCFRVSVVPLGVPPETAVAASWLYHVVQFVPVTLIGLGCLWATGLGWRRVSDGGVEPLPIDGTPDGVVSRDETLAA
ncbi:MAG: lysylphosphatidylglycerol synthase transmembrane domain-containing protein [Planctomycetota bacterium]